MDTFEWILVMLLVAAILAEIARRVSAPYPTLLALGGVGVAFLPGSPQWVLDPQLALALFVAPVLLDSAYDTSLRDLRVYWRPIAGLVFAGVVTTVIGVAFVCRWLVPEMSWPVAIALGAIVAPPDAAAATAIMRQVGLPHRLLSILEGESLLNDASALFIYRLAMMAVATGTLGFQDYLPVFLLTVLGSVAAGIALAFLLGPIMRIPKHVPTSLILQFCSTFGIWILAEKIGLSGILTIVAFAMTMARRGGPQMPPQMRVPILAVWEAVVFLLNALAFVLIGMQLKPIWTRLGSDPARLDAIVVAIVVVAVAIGTRFLWVMLYSAIEIRRVKGKGDAADNKGAWRAGIVVSWSGMRGIVTLAAAFSVPHVLSDGSEFPHRDLILLCAFSVVFGTLVLQGMTMRRVIRLMKLPEDNMVAKEVRAGRISIYQSLIEAIGADNSLHGKLLRKQYHAALEFNEESTSVNAMRFLPDSSLRRNGIAAAREKLISMREQGLIGDQAYRTLVQELDWAELSIGEAG